MTAQVSDSVHLDGTDWSVAAVDGEGLFEPEEHGLQPEATSSANWRGFVCTYAVADGRFVLRDLELSSRTTLDGLPLVPGSSVFGRPVTTFRSFDDALLARDVELPVAFSGRMLVGDGFLWETYEHMGFHPAWRYERVREIVVDGGQVLEVADRSEQLAGIREEIRSGRRRATSASSQRDWIDETFTLSYDRSDPH